MLRCKLKTLLHVLPPTSNIVTQQNFVVASWSSMLRQVELASTFFNKFVQLATTNFVARQCLRWVVIRPTTLYNLQRNNVALQVAAICCSYYFTFKQCCNNGRISWLNNEVVQHWWNLHRCPFVVTVGKHIFRFAWTIMFTSKLFSLIRLKLYRKLRIVFLSRKTLYATHTNKQI